MANFPKSHWNWLVIAAEGFPLVAFQVKAGNARLEACSSVVALLVRWFPRVH
jgi:hypothetical protein